MLQFGVRKPASDYRHRATAFGIVERDGLIACVRVERETGPYFDLPGGGLDLEETEVQALIREFVEETGLTVTPLNRIAEIRRLYGLEMEGTTPIDFDENNPALRPAEQREPQPRPQADEAPLSAEHQRAQPAPGRSSAGPQSAPQAQAEPAAAAEPEPAATTPDPGAGQPEAESAPAASTPATGGIDVEALRRSWPDVLGRIYQMRRATWTFLSEHAQVLTYDGQRLVLGIATVGLANAFRNGSHAEVVRQALIDTLGVDARVEGVPHDLGTAPAGGGAQATSQPASAAPAAPQSSSAGPSPEATSAGAPTGAPVADVGVPAPAGGPAGADWGSAPASAASAPAWATAPVPEPAPEPSPPAEPDDSSVSDDDEDIIDAGAAGPAVIERILGGAVIREE